MSHSTTNVEEPWEANETFCALCEPRSSVFGYASPISSKNSSHWRAKCTLESLNSVKVYLCIFHQTQHYFSSMFLSLNVPYENYKGPASTDWRKNVEPFCEGHKNRNYRLVLSGLDRLYKSLECDIAFRREILAFYFHSGVKEYTTFLKSVPHTGRTPRRNR